MNNTLIETENLTVSFDPSGSPAVNNISFIIERGQTVGIVGESGSGKTITALALMGLLPDQAVTTGRIIFHGSDGGMTDLLKLKGSLLLTYRGKRMAMIFQEPMSSLNPSLRCGRQVAEALLEHTGLNASQAREEVIKLFREVKLPEPEEAYRSFPHQLSGGQRQRVMIAMAIACKPDLVIADEPTTALDVTVQKVILGLLQSLKNKYGLSILFISHDLGVIANIADRVMVMYQGRIVEQGKTNDVISNPGHPYTRGLLACRPPLSGKPQRLAVLADYLNGSMPAGKSQKIREGKISGEMPSSLLLRVKGLTTAFAVKKNIFGKTVKEFKAVKDVSFDLYEGETLGLVGESGCGKTTLGRAILQLIRSGTGEVWYRGTDLSGLQGAALRRFRKNLQIIFQDPFSSLNPGITAGEAIMEPMRVHNIYSTARRRKQKAYELLEKVALSPEHFNRYPHQFSGGQRQRIGIARALAVEPEMIICDESVSALDVSVQAQILNLLNELKDEFGLTYLFISHDLAVVRYMSDRLMVMQNGLIVESGISDKIFARPEQEYTQKLMDAVLRIGPD